MYIVKTGLDYKSAPVEIREQLTFKAGELETAMLHLKQEGQLLENIIVSTCNRTEIYVVTDQLDASQFYIKKFLSKWFHLHQEQFAAYLQVTAGNQAIEHLIRVTSGLDSMIIGETQILGQVKQAFQIAQRVQSAGLIFNELFKQAITFAKRVHKETAISEQAVSVSYAAVELAKKVFGNLHDKHVVIHGAGKMGELAIEHLFSSGAAITVVNRTLEKAEKLAGKFSAKALPPAELSQVLQDTDILISSTNAKSLVLTKEIIAPIQIARKDRPLLMVDIAVPRDLDPHIAELGNVFLYDIDDLQHIVDENMAARKLAAVQIEQQIDGEIRKFNDWYKTLQVIPLITALQRKALSIQSETMQSIERKLPDLTKREIKVLETHTKSIINQLLKEPVLQVKKLASSGQKDEALELFSTIFGLNDHVGPK